MHFKYPCSFCYQGEAILPLKICHLIAFYVYSTRSLSLLNTCLHQLLCAFVITWCFEVFRSNVRHAFGQYAVSDHFSDESILPMPNIL